MRNHFNFTHTLQAKNTINIKRVKTLNLIFGQKIDFYIWFFGAFTLKNITNIMKIHTIFIRLNAIVNWVKKHQFLSIKKFNM